MTDDAGTVELRREGEVCVVTLARPRKLNALSAHMERALQAALDDEALRTSGAVVFTGEGRAFSAGADTGELADRTPEDVMAYYADTGDVYERVAALPQPTIAAIHGYCLGAGLELSLATDLRIADETARLGFPEIALGILPSSGGTMRVTRLVGPGRAKQLILLGERIEAPRALELGLVAEVVAEGGALDRALELATSLAAQPRLAVALTKQAIDAAAESPRQASVLIERLAYGLLSATQDARRGQEG
jgi:enoyl-CoA hydratase/carnithine racemase